MAVHLVCEGERGGLDDRVLDALVVQPNGLNVLVAASGGSSGHGAVRTYLEKRSVHDVAIAIEDRDYYRTRAEANQTWAKPAGKRFTWRRHEIENYLLQPGVVLALFDDYRGTVTAPWVATLPVTESDVSSLLQAVALPLLENHTAEVLRVELLQHLNTIGNLQFGPPTPPIPVGACVPDQAGWIPVLQLEATRLLAAVVGVANLAHLQPSAIAARYQTLVAQYQSPAFLTSGDYLIDMGGHELMAALAAHLRGLGAPGGITEQFLSSELLRVLSPLYRPGLFYQPDDFQELATILAQY